jgi:nucleotide-binding universal stress UspA family protein
MFDRILLAVDGSEHSIQAAKVAGEIARTMRSQALRVVVVLEDLPGHVDEPHETVAINARLENGKAVLRKTCEILGKIPGELQCELTEGPSAEAVSSVARMRGSTMIVMAPRCPEVAAELILEGMNGNAASRASCPVLIVR